VAPHPEAFSATDKAKALTAKIVSFEPNGLSSVVLSNTSNEFIAVSSISFYYFGKIYTPEMKRVEIPPRGATADPIILKSVFPVSMTFEDVTMENAAQKKFDFGIAVKYTRGNVGDATLLDQRQLSVRDLLE
jgi:hypothetical protein